MKVKPTISRLFIAIVIGLVVLSCDTSKLMKTPIDSFIGSWELQGRTMFNGIKIKIEKTENNEFVGKVVAINQDKYVKMFVDTNDVRVTEIKQLSNYEFRLTERKIGSAMFTLYGQDTKTEFKAQFIDKNTLGLATGNSEPTKSTILYKRLDK